MTALSLSTSVSLETLVTRFNRGYTATIRIFEDTNYVVKTYRKGMCENLLNNELYWLRYLNESGLTPELHPDYLEDNYGDNIVMAKINQAASLGDYSEAFLAGEISARDLTSIFEAVNKTLQEWKEYEIVHNDLHADNVCLTWTDQGWRAYIIDLSWSYQEGEMPDWIDYERSWVAEDFDDDLQHLIKDLLNRGPDLQEFVDILQ
jgi:Ser/Thr protein kinase RdoA (MazF antagonist)